MHDRVALLVSQREQAGRNRLLGLPVDRRDRLEPLVGVELSQRFAVYPDGQPTAERLGIDDQSVRDERGVDAAQGVDDALRFDASQ